MFGFPNTIHKQFKNNFLKTVIFQISFDENSNCIQKKDDIISLFGSNFPRINQNATKGFQISFKQKEQTPILQTLSDEEGVEFKSIDGQKIILINRTSFSITVGGRAYKTFNKLKEDISNINKFFDICDIQLLKKIAIRKMNVFEFKLIENPSEILAYIMSSDLLSNLSFFPNTEIIKQNIQNVVYIKDDYRLNLKYGLNVPPPPNKDVGQIIVDIDLINSSKTYGTTNLFEIANQMNQEIYNIFNWAISDYTKDLLNK